MNKDQQKTVNEMLDAMELDTYGEKGLKEIIRQLVVEMVKQSAPPKRAPIFNYISPDYITGEYLEAYDLGFSDAEKAHGITGVDDDN
jgi:hypothetical protein